MSTGCCHFLAIFDCFWWA